MVVCNDLENLTITIRSILVATMDAMTVEELWNKVVNLFNGEHNIQLNLFGYNTFFELLKHLPNTVQLEDPENENSIVNLVSSKKSRHMEILVSFNTKKPPSLKQKISKTDLIVPYRTQCAFIRVLIELYPKGLSISNFVSDVMCYPIFKSFINQYEVLLYNLAHIFKRYGHELLCIQPRIVNNVQCLKEKNKFKAKDIFAIDQDSLESTIVDQQLAYGLEYPLFNILEEPIRDNIKILLEEQPSWITERQICNLYNEKFGSSFSHFRRWGFTRVSIMFSKLPELCHINLLSNEIEIISLKSKIFDESKKHNLAKDINDDQTTILPTFRTFSKDRSERNNKGLLYTFLIDDPYLKVPLDDCFLDQKVQSFELKLNKSYNILVCRVDVDLTPTLICQNDESIELKNLLIDMEKFYSENGYKFKFESTIAMVKHPYAYFLDGMWHRGLVTEIGFRNIKVINIDDGSVNTISHENLRLLHTKFSELPAQSFECQLYGLTHINKTDLNQIINKKCVINVVQIDQFNKRTSVKIKYLNSTSCAYLNDEWISSGAAIAQTRESCSNEEY